MATFNSTGNVGGSTLNADTGVIIAFSGGTVADLQDAAGDTISGGWYADTIVAGSGDDTIRPSNGADYTDGRDGSDIYEYFAGDAGSVGKILTDTGGASDVDTVRLFGSSDFSDKVCNGIEAVEFRPFGIDETRFATFNASQLISAFTLTGADNLNSWMIIEVASDFSASEFVLNNWSQGQVWLIGTSAANNMTGSDGLDRLIGNGGLDNLDGGEGNDTYLFGEWVEAVVAATVADTGSASDFDMIEAGGNLDFTSAAISGIEGVYLNGEGGVKFNSDQLPGDLQVTGLLEVQNALEIGVDGSFSASGWTFVDWEAIDAISFAGSAAADSITGTSQADTIDGGDGADVLNGNGGTDTMIGGAGNDTYVTDGGDTITEGSGAGTDTVSSSVNYTLGANLENLNLTGTAVTGTGNTLGNTINGNASNNTLNGGDGNDILNGLGGSDTQVGGAGNDTFHFDVVGDTATELAGGGTDLVRTLVSINALGANLENVQLNGVGNFLVVGNTLANVINGNSGINQLRGLDGNDLLFGFDGVDTLLGGAGKDQMAGGNGDDDFHFDALSDMGNSITTRDVITDFAVGSDDLDFNTMDANSVVAGNQNFTWRGTGAFTGAGQLRYIQSGGNTIVQGNLDNNLATVEFEVQLNGLKALTAGDIVL